MYTSDFGGSKNIRGYWYSLSAYEISSVRLSGKYSSVVVTDALPSVFIKLNKGEIIVAIMALFASLIMLLFQLVFSAGTMFRLIFFQRSKLDQYIISSVSYEVSRVDSYLEK